MARKTTRRGLLATGAALTAGTAVVAIAPDNQDVVAASVQSNGLSVSDTSHEQTDALADITLAVDATADYEANVALDDMVATLSVGPAGDVQQITATSLPLGDANGQKTFTLSSSVFDHSALHAGDFEPAVGNSKDTELTVELLCEFAYDGDVVATAELTDTATITVTNNNLGVSTTVTGTGGFTVSE